MDPNGFRDPTSPWLFSNTESQLIETRVRNQEAPLKQTLPTPDNVYKGWAARMEDGRIATDYRPKCARNIPAGRQFATKAWMQAHGDEIIQLSRRRQAEESGAGRSIDPQIVVPAYGYQKCDEVSCGIKPANLNGIGIERQEPVPDLFGTFAESSFSYGAQRPVLKTQFEEGGRNTVRGQFSRV